MLLLRDGLAGPYVCVNVLIMHAFLSITVSLNSKQRLLPHNGPIHTIIINELTNQELFTASEDTTIRIWTLHETSLTWKCGQVCMYIEGMASSVSKR